MSLKRYELSRSLLCSVISVALWAVDLARHLIYPSEKFFEYPCLNDGNSHISSTLDLIRSLCIWQQGVVRAQGVRSNLTRVDIPKMDVDVSYHTKALSLKDYCTLRNSR